MSTENMNETKQELKQWLEKKGEVLNSAPITPPVVDVNYIINDPSTPDAIIPVKMPEALQFPSIRIDGFKGATQQMGTIEHQAACCFITITNALNLANKYLSKKVVKWAKTNTLFVQTRAGKQLNAYYDRAALRFFYAVDPVTKQTVYAANSTDVVAHELGHAILDAVRPDLYNVQSMEIWAFHESFGDMNAILNILQHDFVLDYVLKETNNDLRKSNLATKLAEEMGTAIYNLTGGRMGHTSGMLRNAFNTFNYIPPQNLAKIGKDNQLTAEPHSFSRVFTGAWYDILAGMYEFFAKTMPPKEAFIQARDTLARYTYQALPIAPATVSFFDAVARALLVVDKSNNYQFNEMMNEVFIKRNILKFSVKPMLGINWELYKEMVDSSQDEIYSENDIVAVRNKKIDLVNMPIHMMNVEVPSDVYYEFDSSGECVETLTASMQEQIDHAENCIEFLKVNDMIRPDKLTPFEINDEGTLVRSHFACNFCQKKS